MKNLLAILLLGLTFIVTAQQTQNIPGAPTQGINYGDVYEISLTNTTNHSITVTPLWNYPGHEQILISNQNFYNFVGGGDLMDALDNLAFVEKSPLHRNAHLLWDSWGKSYQTKLMYSPMLFNHSLFDAQCGNYAEESARTLNHIGKADSSMLQSVVLLNDSMGGHVVFEVKPDTVHGIKVDHDPGQPQHLQTYAGSPVVFASAMNIHDNPSILNERYSWVDETGALVDLCSYNSLTRYGGYYDSVRYSPFYSLSETVEDVSGKWTLLPGESISWKMEVSRLFLDTTGLTQQQLNDMYVLFMQAQSGDTVALDSMVRMIALQTGYPYSVTKACLLNGSLTVAGFDKYFRTYYTDALNDEPQRTPLLTVTIPPAQTTKLIGKNQDHSLPFFVHQVSCSGGSIVLGNTTVSNTVYPLYDTTVVGTPGRASPNLPDSLIQTLGTTGAIPGGVSVNASVYFNPEYYNWFKGMKFQYSGTDSLTVATSIIKANFNPTGVAEIVPSKLVIYPNPVSVGQIFYTTELCEVFDVTGKSLGVGNVAPMVPGLYLVAAKKKIGMLVVVP